MTRLKFKYRKRDQDKIAMLSISGGFSVSHLMMKGTVSQRIRMKGNTKKGKTLNK